jgi:hypothetical protein
MMPAMHDIPHPSATAAAVQEPSCLHLWLSTPRAAQYFDPSALEAAERLRFQQIRSALRRQEFEVSRALRRQAQAADPRPTVESLSHSGGYAALLRAPPGRLIGVDLEVHRPRDVLSIARGVFAPAEVEVLQGLASLERDSLFYALWTMKEALGKALRLNLLEALRECQFVPGAQGWHGSAPTRAAGSVAIFRPRPDMSLAVACVGGGREPALQATIQTWSWPPRLATSWPLIAAISLAAADAPAATGRETAGAAPAAAPASDRETDGSSCESAPARPLAVS